MAPKGGRPPARNCQPLAAIMAVLYVTAHSAYYAYYSRRPPGEAYGYYAAGNAGNATSAPVANRTASGEAPLALHFHESVLYDATTRRLRLTAFADCRRPMPASGRLAVELVWANGSTTVFTELHYAPLAQSCPLRYYKGGELACKWGSRAVVTPPIDFAAGHAIHQALGLRVVGGGSAIRWPALADSLHIMRSNAPVESGMAVCTQPLFLFSDWPLLARFLEFWLANGADRVFVYLQSSTADAARLLAAYEADGLVDIMRWSLVPANNGSGAEPNARAYRADMKSAINHCLWRTKGHYRHTVLVDWDEIITPVDGTLNTTLKEYMSSHNLNDHPALSVRRVYVKAARAWHGAEEEKENGKGARVTQPADVNLDRYSPIVRQKAATRWDPKLIVRPHAVDAVDPHYVARWARGSGTPVAAGALRCWHMRKASRPEWGNGVQRGWERGQSDVLRFIANTAQRRWLSMVARHWPRLDHSDLTGAAPFSPTKAAALYRLADAHCRTKGTPSRCGSPNVISSCPMLADVHSWQYVENSWKTIVV